MNVDEWVRGRDDAGLGDTGGRKGKKGACTNEGGSVRPVCMGEGEAAGLLAPAGHLGRALHQNAGSL